MRRKHDSGEMYSFDRQYFSNEDTELLCGVDEAGRGPLAGPVFAAAVILDYSPGNEIEGLNDSKKLSPLRREKLFDEIIIKAKSFYIASSDVAMIEEINILNASMLAMKQAVESLSISPICALIDGNQAPDIICKAVTVIKGDARSAAISAASILAKVARDKYMCEVSKLYREYGFERHKGYGTKDHFEKIRQYGPCREHRLSFLKKYYERNQNE